MKTKSKRELTIRYQASLGSANFAELRECELILRTRLAKLRAINSPQVPEVERLLKVTLASMENK